MRPATSTGPFYPGTLEVKENVLEVATRWALLASIALHVAVIALSLSRPLSAVVAEPLRADFWAGSTFEVPEGLGEGEPPTETGEVNTEGLDPSTATATSTSTSTSTATPTATPTATSTTSTSTHHAPAHAAAAAPGGTGNGTFGAEAGPRGVRDLLRSFVRAIPIVASSDPVWSTLPLGNAGNADLVLVLDEEGRPHIKAPFGSSVPSHLARLVNKTLLVMASGRFAVTTAGAGGAEQRIHIALALTQEAPPSSDLASAGGAFGLRFEPPDEHQVSRAFFTLASGRRVEVSVRALASR
jgi:hypothetical protein